MTFFIQALEQSILSHVLMARASIIVLDTDKASFHKKNAGYATHPRNLLLEIKNVCGKVRQIHRKYIFLMCLV